MNLDIDIGNTRLKWRLRDASGSPVAGGAIPHDLWRRDGLQVHGVVEQVRVCSVNGRLNDEITEYCRQQFDVEPRFATVGSEVAGLRCGYRVPSQLGVDRWLATLACWHNISRRALIVSAGTALTIDVMDGEGHVGGYILPGIALARGALASGTWGVRAVEPDEAGLAPGVDTDQAVANGVLLALVATVEKVAGAQAVETVVLTGGDGATLKHHLAAMPGLREVPDLVLDGLAVALP